jgi:hypothetical protein
LFTVTCILIAAEKIKTLLWHMQEDMESFRQWKLGEEIYKLLQSFFFFFSPFLLGDNYYIIKLSIWLIKNKIIYLDVLSELGTL